MITATRYHDFCAGHRVAGHENKCAQLHGHNYRVHFTLTTEIIHESIPLKDYELDTLGRVIDFSVIKEKLCMWLERNWDHKFLAWEQDEYMHLLERTIEQLCPVNYGEAYHPVAHMLDNSVIYVPFNPTAENMAKYLIEEVGPRQLEGTGVELIKVVVDETRKCSATYERRF
jgi:6-pyruvoyltetrahydropterin/6-carboxytetrahydropterin synthase